MSMDFELEVKQLKATLEEKEEVLSKAAQFGRQLLDTNLELEQQLDENTKTYCEKIEALEQEKHSLQLKFNCQSSNLASVQQELDSVQRQLEDKHQDELKRVEEVYQRKAHEEAALNGDLKADVEKLEVQLKMLNEKSRHQEETLEQLKEELDSHNTTHSTTLQHELNDLEQQYLDERTHCECLQSQLLEAEGSAEVLAVEREGLLTKVASLEEECQERCRLSNEWFKNLKEVKDQNMALKSELDLLKLEQKRGFHGSKGNSLFGEVEDKRVEAERKLISLQVKHESLQKNHSITKQRYARLKAEMSALFCRYSATSADSEHLQRLQRALSQSHSENESLRSKIHKLETQLADGVSVQDKRKLVSAFVDFGDKAEYIQFLGHEIDQTKSQHTTVLKELDMKRTQLVWESNKLSEAESKLYHSEQQNARKKEDLTKLRLRLQDTLEKLNQCNTKIAQLEADKKFLEGELKSRHKRSSLAPRQDHSQSNSQQSDLVQSVCASSSSTSIKSTNSGDTLSNDSSSDLNLKKSSSSNSLKPLTEGVQRENSFEKVEQPRRVINLLEELETEFSKQKSGVQQTVERSGVENSRPVPTSKVVHVSNKKADQCAQQ